MGWFKNNFISYQFCNKFSSPLGVGLVLWSACLYHSSVKVFVPEWGWGGSVQDTAVSAYYAIFVPEWGWVGS